MEVAALRMHVTDTAIQDRTAGVPCTEMLCLTLRPGAGAAQVSLTHKNPAPYPLTRTL